MQDVITKILLGDSKDVLKTIDDNCIDLIVTSPPYADRRKNTYGGIAPEKYVEWFLPISEQLFRVLKVLKFKVFKIIFYLKKRYEETKNTLCNNNRRCVHRFERRGNIFRRERFGLYSKQNWRFFRESMARCD